MKTNYERAGRIKASTKKMERLASNSRKTSRTDESKQDNSGHQGNKITTGDPITDDIR